MRRKKQAKKRNAFEKLASLKGLSLSELKKELQRALRAYNAASDRANKSGIEYHKAMQATESGTQAARDEFKRVRDYSEACFREKADLDAYTAKIEDRIRELKAKGKQQNPRYLVTGDGRELAILADPNKMQAVRRAKTLYPGFRRYEATLTDKATYLGRAPKKAEYGAKLPAKRKAKKRNLSPWKCGICGEYAGDMPGPEHSQFCPRYKKPLRARRTFGAKKKKNRTIIKAGKIEHLDVSKVHNGRRRNALAKDADHPIEVTRHYRQGPPGYLSPWQRAAALGQNELFETGIKLSKRAGEMRARRGNPGASKRVYQSGLKEATAGQLGRLARIGLRTGLTPSQIAADLKQTGRFNAGQISQAIDAARQAETRKNPARASKTRQVYEKFSGKKAKRQTTLTAPKGTPAQVAKLGRLRLIRTTDGRKWAFAGSKAPFLTADHKGKLHVVGGQYRANPAGEALGEIERIEYETSKPHLGQTQPTIYFHDMGEETGERPTLKIDSEGLIKITGGAYRIEADGIHN